MSQTDSTSGRMVTLWETKNDELMTGEISVSLLELIVKESKMQNFKAVKLFGRKEFSASGKRVMSIDAKPCDPYVKGQTGAKPSQSRTW